MSRRRLPISIRNYSRRGPEKVYNPYDVLLLLRRGEFAAHWFETRPVQ